MWDICNQLEGMSAGGARKQLEQDTGIQFLPEGLLFCKPLRDILDPVRTNRYDSMHVLFSNGLASAELMLCADHFKEHLKKNLFDIVREVSVLFSPRMHLYSEARVKNSGDLLRCTAAEILEGYKLFRYGLLQVFGDSSQEVYVLSALSLFAVLDVVSALIKGLVPGWKAEDTARVLRNRVKTYLELSLIHI